MIVETHGEVCRLGYLRVIASLIRDGREVGLDYVASLLERVCSNALKNGNYGERVLGLITSRVAARNYVILSQGLDFINRSSKRVGFNGLTYLGLRSSSKFNAIVDGVLIPTHNDLLQLNDVEKVFFMNVLLNKDYYMMREVIGWIVEKGEFTRVEAMNWIMEEAYPKSLSMIVESSPKKVRELLLPKLEEARTFRDKRLSYTSKSDWIKSNLYAKYRHIAPPRIEWLVDLGLLERVSRGRYKVRELVRNNEDVFTKLAAVSREQVTEYILSHVAPLYVKYGSKAGRDSVVSELLGCFKALSLDNTRSVDVKLLELATCFRLLENNQYATMRFVHELLNNLTIVYPEKVFIAPGEGDRLEIVKLDIEASDIGR